MNLVCPIVGVGASAGGLEAFTQLLKHLSIDTGMAFVLIQHLDPSHASLLTELLARATVCKAIATRILESLRSFKTAKSDRNATILTLTIELN